MNVLEALTRIANRRCMCEDYYTAECSTCIARVALGVPLDERSLAKPKPKSVVGAIKQETLGDDVGECSNCGTTVYFAPLTDDWIGATVFCGKCWFDARRDGLAEELSK